MRFVSYARNRYFTYLTIFIIYITIIYSLYFSTNVPNVSAADTASRWTEINLPKAGAAGNWALASGSDVQRIVMAADGTLYAYVSGLSSTLLKSTDGGIKWIAPGQISHTIKDIAVSPYDSNLLYCATTASVYRSADGGKSFVQLPVPGGAGAGHKEITSVASAWFNGNIICAGTRDTDSGEWGGVYTFDESKTIPDWEDAGIGSFDVYRVAFSPGYATDQQIIAAATDETESFVFNKIGTSGWNAFFGAASLKRDNAGVPASVILGESATMAFPDDYIAGSGQAENALYIGIDTGTGQGDVFKVTLMDTPLPSVAQDMNVSGIAGSLDIASLTVRGESGAVSLAAGAADDTRIYTSIDDGINWLKSQKAPAGNGITGVLFAPDFFTTATMYAAAAGPGSAFSISRDMGMTWNQCSLVDTNITGLVDMECSPEYSLDNTLFLLTSGNGPERCLWRTVNGGVSWERILSIRHPAVDSLNYIGLAPAYGADCHTLFVTGASGIGSAIWSSDDNGQSFRLRITHDRATGASFEIDAWAILDENTLIIGSYNGVNGMVYQTSNRGFTYSDGVPVGNVSISTLAVSPDYLNDKTLLAGNSAGAVFRSTDGGVSFSPLPTDGTQPPSPGNIRISFDPLYRENHIIYLCGDSADAGFYRLRAEENTGWENIDDTLPSGAYMESLFVSENGVLYGANANAGGGMERCLNPAARDPRFDTAAAGLVPGATLLDIDAAGNRIFALDTTNLKLMAYHDTLAGPVIQELPVNTASGTGSLSNHTIKNITIDWQAMTGAASYEWQCSDIADFSSIPVNFQGTVTASSVHLPELEPATIYYWRVRVKTPVLSPWSAIWYFTTSLDTELAALKPESPPPGAGGVPLRPVFQWAAVTGASSYELLVATDTGFTHAVVIKINDYALTSNAWECDVNLDYNTTYYWRVRAMTDNTRSAWSSTGVFTTLAAPSTAPEITGEKPEIPLLENLDGNKTSPSSPGLPPPATSGEFLVTPPAAPAAPPDTPVNPSQIIPGWMIYFIGGLLAIVMLALFIVLAVVLKIKRF